MHVTVTGASGHIGNNLVRYLLQHNFTVRAVYRTATKHYIFKDLDIEHRTGDILDYAFVEDVCKATDVVVHLAGVISIDGDPSGIVHKTNTVGVRHIVEACKRNGIKKLIHFSSIHAFNLHTWQDLVDERCAASDETCMAYDFSKAEGEKEIIRSIQEGMDAYILHPTGVIGPHDYFNSYSGILLKKLFSGRLPALLSGGFDWVDVQDVCKMTGYLIKIPEQSDPNVYSRRFIVSGHFADLHEIAKRCSFISGQKPPYLTISKQIAKMGLPIIRVFAKLNGSAPIYTSEAIEALIERPIQFSNDKAKLAFGYNPRALSATLKDCYDWYKEHNFIK